MAGASHIASALSMVDYVYVTLREVIMSESALVLGKPFGAQAYYAAMTELGLCESSVAKYCHPDFPDWSYIIGREHRLVDFIDDTMGNALGVAVGMAISARRRVVVNASDAYMQTGTSWEAVALAGALGISNLFLTIDNNRVQAQGYTDDIVTVEPLDERFRCFGWQPFRCNGHSLVDIGDAWRVAREDRSGKPKVLVFDTCKGYGVSFICNNPQWHYGTLDDESLRRGLVELDA